MRITVVIPAHNEQDAIGEVLKQIPQSMPLEVIVVDNASRDDTGKIATQYGARVVREPRGGYGFACMAGIAAAANPDIIVFLDGDASHYPREISNLVEPIIEDKADLVIGTRMKGKRRPASFSKHTLFANKVYSFLMKSFFSEKTTDLGPFRAVRASIFRGLQMQERGFGWLPEMPAKAVRLGPRLVEVPVSYQGRIGRSRVDESIIPSLHAGLIVTRVMFKARYRKPK